MEKDTKGIVVIPKLLEGFALDEAEIITNSSWKDYTL